MSDQPSSSDAATPAAAQIPAATVAPVGGGVSFLTTVIVAAALAAFSGTLSWHFATSAQAQRPQVVIIDAAKIAEARVKQALSKPNLGSEGAAREGEEFMRQFNGVLDAYSQSGVVVINSSVALNRPVGLDLTDVVASRLGVELR